MIIIVEGPPTLTYPRVGDAFVVGCTSRTVSSPWIAVTSAAVIQDVSVQKLLCVRLKYAKWEYAFIFTIYCRQTSLKLAPICQM
jgi:hypothetical protein